MGKLLAPVNGLDAGARLIAAGAEELYMGFHDDEWERTFGAQASLNRMSGFGQSANALSFEELLEEAARLTAAQAPNASSGTTAQPTLFCVFNAVYYTTAQVRFIVEHYLGPLAKAGFAGIIVSGTALCASAHQLGLTTVASVMMHVYNTDIARQLAQAGIDRVIMPRDLPLADIEALVTATPELQYEVFFMRNGCIFADSHCLGLHFSDRPALCRALRDAESYEQYSSFGYELACGTAEQHELNHQVYCERFHLNTCGLCALYRFEQLGINAYKIVGRSDDIDDLCADVALCAENLAIAHTARSESDYLQAMARPAGILQLCANEGLSCYYPQIRFQQ